MTGRETLRMYARLRGIPETRIEAMIQAQLAEIRRFKNQIKLI
jgi:ABC-type multidrug transport system ATPase subunit